MIATVSVMFVKQFVLLPILLSVNAILAVKIALMRAYLLQTTSIRVRVTVSATNVAKNAHRHILLAVIAILCVTSVIISA